MTEQPDVIFRCKACRSILSPKKKDDSYTCYKCKNNKIYDVLIDKRSPNYTERKKSLAPVKVITRPEVISLICKMKGITVQQKRDRAMIAFLYLTGARIGEIVGVRMPPKQSKTITEMNEIKYIKRNINQIEYIVKPITKDQITFSSHEGEKVIKINDLPVFKKRGEVHCLKYCDENVTDKIDSRTVVLIYDIEKEFWQYVQDYITLIPETAILFPISYQRAWEITKNNTSLWNHYFRHARATHLKIHHDFSGVDLQQYIGWKDPRMPNKYAHLEWRNLASKMMRNRF